jgi:DNA repair photolyase
METMFETKEKRELNLKVIYKPKGKAGEYAKYAVNLYNGCTHGCRYCYVPIFTRQRPADFHRQVVPRNNILNLLKLDCIEAEGKIHENVLLCFLTDPYPPTGNELTRRALMIFREHNIPFTVLTKGGKRAIRDFDLYSKRDEFASTLTLITEERRRKWEPFAEPFESRVEALREAKQRGITTWVSLEPVIDPAETLKIIEQTHEFVDLYKVGKLNYVQSKINWRDFALKAIEVLEKFGKNYYVKNDLRMYLFDGDEGDNGKQDKRQYQGGVRRY